jgi:glucose-fructose oxidoreductase
LPIAVQPRFVRAALLAGKPVLSEKPIAPSVAEARKLLKVAGRCGVPWLVGENFAFMSHVERVQRWLGSGKLGNVRLVEARQISWMDEKNPYFHTPWRQSPEHPGGFVVDGGVHLANIVRRCFGMPVRVRSLTACFNPLLPPVDTAVAALQFESGALGTWISCFSAHPRAPLLQIHGTRGHIAVGYDFAELTELSGKQTRVAGNDSFAAQFKHFADVVKRGAVLQVTPEQALDDLRLVAALLDAR